MRTLTAVALVLFTSAAFGEQPSVMCSHPTDLIMPDGARIPGLFDRFTKSNGQLTGVGVEAPGTVDAVIVGKGQTFLVWVEPTVLTTETFNNFQSKVNAYVVYALDGRLVKQYPDSKGTKLVIYLTLLCKQSDARLENLRSIAPQLKQAGLEFVINDAH
jgi:hypothetical protein